MSVANEVRNRLIPFRRFFPLGASAELTSIFRQYLWALPLIALLFAFLQKYFVAGLTSGAVKG